jgi:hypothetical protein
MIALQNYFPSNKIDEFQGYRFDNKLSDFDINQNSIIFFDLENNYETNRCLKN